MSRIADLLKTKEVSRMAYYPGHRVHHRSLMKGENGATFAKKIRLNHCLRVAYICYTVAGILGLDRGISARAGLLHDCGLDPRSSEPRIVQILRHASRGALISHRLGESYEVSKAIYSHMFPLNPRFPPSSGISLVLWFADKLDAVLETLSFSTVLDKTLNQYRISITPAVRRTDSKAKRERRKRVRQPKSA
ncbi:MAG: HD domain-containing protein [Promethearchaeati archaeon SRVP18_Atabeyarchaeia-1]